MVWPYDNNPAQYIPPMPTQQAAPAPMPVAQRAAPYQPPQMTQGQAAVMPSLLAAQPNPLPQSQPGVAGGGFSGGGGGGLLGGGGFTPPQQQQQMPTATPMQSAQMPAPGMGSSFAAPGQATMPSFSGGVQGGGFAPGSFTPSSVTQGSGPTASFAQPATYTPGTSTLGSASSPYLGPTHQMLVESFQQSLGRQNEVPNLLSKYQIDPNLARQQAGLLSPTAPAPGANSKFYRLDWNLKKDEPAAPNTPHVVYVSPNNFNGGEVIPWSGGADGGTNGSGGTGSAGGGAGASGDSGDGSSGE